MKTIKLSITGIVVLFILFSCSNNKQAQLSKLKQQQTAINDKIRSLEGEISTGRRILSILGSLNLSPERC